MSVFGIIVKKNKILIFLLLIYFSHNMVEKIIGVYLKNIGLLKRSRHGDPIRSP